jgi:hypothetical protein
MADLYHDSSARLMVKYSSGSIAGDVSFWAKNDDQMGSLRLYSRLRDRLLWCCVYASCRSILMTRDEANALLDAYIKAHAHILKLALDDEQSEVRLQEAVDKLQANRERLINVLMAGVTEEG